MFSKFFKKSPLADFKVVKLNNDELEKAQANDEISIVSQFYQEELVEIPTREGIRVHIAKVPYALIARESVAVVSELKKKINIGIDNFPEYENLKALVEELKFQNHNLAQDMKPIKDENKDLQSRLDYLKIILGNDTFNNAMNSYESVKKQREATQA